MSDLEIDNLIYPPKGWKDKPPRAETIGDEVLRAAEAGRAGAEAWESWHQSNTWAETASKFKTDGLDDLINEIKDEQCIAINPAGCPRKENPAAYDMGCLACLNHLRVDAMFLPCWIKTTAIVIERVAA